MSEAANGSGPVRRVKQSIEATVHSLSEWRDQHQTDCIEGAKAVAKRLDHVEETVTRMAGQVDLLVTAFVKEKEHPDGSTTVGWRIPTPSGKTILGIVGAFGGIVAILQLTIVMAAPAIKAGLEWVMSYGH